MKLYVLPALLLLGEGRSAAAAQVPAVTAGLASKVLGEDRSLRVYLPESYGAHQRRYPVIYALDGEATGPFVASAVEFMTGYSAIPQMPDAIIVAVTNADRNRDMPVQGAYGRGGEERFLTFLA